jgi:plastocyanin
MNRSLALGVLSTLTVVAAAAAGMAADLHAMVRNQKGQPVADAVVVAVPDVPPAKPPRPKLEQVEQIDEEFVPKVKALLVGSPVSFPNRDNVRHHVYSFSPAKRFDLPLYVGTPATPIIFDTPGVVTLGCNIHDWMIGYIYVSESPYYATTGADGRASISMPAGAYTVRVWHPQLAAAEDSTRRKLEVQNTADVEWALALKPEVRIRRTPPGTGRKGGY